MGKRKLQVDSWSVESSTRSPYLTIYFNRPLSTLEAEGIVHLVKERLARNA